VRVEHAGREAGFEPVDLSAKSDQIDALHAQRELRRVLVEDCVHGGPQAGERVTAPVQTLAIRPE